MRHEILTQPNLFGPTVAVESIVPALPIISAFEWQQVCGMWLRRAGAAGLFDDVPGYAEVDLNIDLSHVGHTVPMDGPVTSEAVDLPEVGGGIVSQLNLRPLWDACLARKITEVSDFDRV